MDIDTSVFNKMSVAQLKQIEQKLIALRKERQKLFILPKTKQYIKPVKDKHIKPLHSLHIKPINKALKELRKYLPADKKYWIIGSSKFGPMTKTDLIKLIKECK